MTRASLVSIRAEAARVASWRIKDLRQAAEHLLELCERVEQLEHERDGWHAQWAAERVRAERAETAYQELVELARRA